MILKTSSISLILILLLAFSFLKIQSRQLQNIIKNTLTLEEPKICEEGNRFQFIAAYVLGRQSDLTKAFAEIQKTITIANVSYSDVVYRNYTIFNLKPKFTYLQSKQGAQVRGINVLTISGGTARITYDFQWEKVQLGSKILGTGSGIVSTDSILFQKTLQTNNTHELEWVLTKTVPLAISNSLTLSVVTPYKQSDYAILNEMLNFLKNNLTTVKQRFIEGMNRNYSNILREIVKKDETMKIQKEIQYSYNDYRGEFTVLYDNILLQNSLTKQGLSLLLSQSIRDYKAFQCDKVPDQPADQSVFGGLQQYMSNKLLKSTIHYALEQGFLDVTLTQDNWQSRAFQFYMGDLHDVMASTKNISSFRQLNGRCDALNDKYFNLVAKTASSYELTVNFTCSIFDNGTKVVDIILPVNYQITPKLNPKTLDFIVTGIQGKPQFVQNDKYKITNQDLAQFIVTETLNTAISSKVLGSGYRTTNRRFPNLWVKDSYLFLYDSSQKPKKKTTQKIVEQ